jgi:LAO/AO transport system kinase
LSLSVQALCAGLLGGESQEARQNGRPDSFFSESKRRALAKSITLIESTLPEHRAQADELLTRILPHTGQALRLGISGVPGVGKSTFIEVLGLYLISQGHRLAVLAVDPSSSVSGGSILGDKTRMERLSVNPNAFIRPSPSKGTLGGVAEKTREAILLCEAAGFDVVMVETVGVGQSETTVASMTDLFVLMQLPNAGDDLQAIKKGVMELADLVVINKADLDPGAATRAEAQITSALRLYGFHGNPAHAHHSNFGMDDSNGERAKGVAIPTSALNEATRKLANTKVMQISALLDRGIELFWQTIKAHQLARQSSSQWLARRRAQEISFVWERVEGELKRSFDEHPNVQKILPSIMSSVNAGVLAPSLAARRLISAYTGEGN